MIVIDEAVTQDTEILVLTSGSISGNFTDVIVQEANANTGMRYACILTLRTVH